MANLYDLKKFDLNLLVIFECIYQHLSISKAAETLYITPSAVSQSLQRLRTQFNDPLFIRSGKGITPTVTGINLHHHLEKDLNTLEQTINIMHGSSLKKKFIIYSPQISTSIPVKELFHFIREDAYVEIEHHDILTSAETAEDLLAYRKTDLVLTTIPINNRSIVCTPFKIHETILVCSGDHPRLDRLNTLADILEEQFTMFYSEDEGIKQFQSKTEHLLANRKIGFRSDSLVSIANVIASTDIIGMLPRAIFELYEPSLKLKEIKLDITLPSNTLYLMYNRSSLNNQSFADFINKITLNID
ncbi:LysR family transcriptional regulator [Citrobacter freundii]|uniref:LysR family transcriptional regulator n=1 Tax=Citrobacter arsenatis TaxID=2546350 RepID=A0A4P6WIB1_9ENTR|nr:LysR family transcriptional regulator [Citrobacter arsenatis]POT28109.1 LysR family transcriptional regulator [Citrobacter freundii]QBM22417.1 LysR family transcriptional regulator [Citrobacter arsenatis]